MERFIEILVRILKEKRFEKKEKIDEIISKLNKLLNDIKEKNENKKGDKLENIEITREEGHIDILIKINGNCIIIENKINNAFDRDYQLSTYVNYVSEKNLKPICVVYISPTIDRKPPSNDVNSIPVIHLPAIGKIEGQQNQNDQGLSIIGWLDECANELVNRLFKGINDKDYTDLKDLFDKESKIIELYANLMQYRKLINQKTMKNDLVREFFNKIVHEKNTTDALNNIKTLITLAYTKELEPLFLLFKYTNVFDKIKNKLLEILDKEKQFEIIKEIDKHEIQENRQYWKIRKELKIRENESSNEIVATFYFEFEFIKNNINFYYGFSNTDVDIKQYFRTILYALLKKENWDFIYYNYNHFIIKSFSIKIIDVINDIDKNNPEFSNAFSNKICNLLEGENVFNELKIIFNSVSITDKKLNFIDEKLNDILNSEIITKLNERCNDLKLSFEIEGKEENNEKKIFHQKDVPNYVSLVIKIKKGSIEKDYKLLIEYSYKEEPPVYYGLSNEKSREIYNYYKNKNEKVFSKWGEPSGTLICWKYIEHFNENGINIMIENITNLLSEITKIDNNTNALNTQ